MPDGAINAADASPAIRRKSRRGNDSELLLDEEQHPG
jgi:hypothetical protein